MVNFDNLGNAFGVLAVVAGVVAYQISFFHELDLSHGLTKLEAEFWTKRYCHFCENFVTYRFDFCILHKLLCPKIRRNNGSTIR